MKNNTSSASSTYIAAERHGLPMISQILPADALPVDADRFSIGIARDGVVVILAA